MRVKNMYISLNEMTFLMCRKKNPKQSSECDYNIGMCFITFSQGASCTIQNAPHFIFSTISHLCALCLVIDLIAKMDFKWIACKVTKAVIETQVD